MEKHELKEYLEEYMYDYQYLKAKINEIEKYDKMIGKNITSSSFSDNKEYEEQKMSKLMDKKREIESTIDLLKQPYRTVMYLKYICFSTFDQIADKLSYSTKRIYQLHGEGLEQLSSILTDNEQNDNHN